MPPEQSSSTTRRSLDTISIWALFGTLVISLILVIPSASIPFIATKTFVLAAGAIITLALYILARLSRGNVISPPWMMIALLWLPVVAYTLSALFSGVMFDNALWGTSLETDTLGLMLVVSILGTLGALLLRRPENYRSFLRVSSLAFAGIIAVQVLIVLLGQFVPTKLSPSLSILGTYDDLAAVLGLGVICTLLAFRFLDIAKRARAVLLAAIVGSLFILAIANSALVWTLIALVSLGLFVESVMRRASGSSNMDLDDLTSSNESTPAEQDSGHRSLVMPLAILAVSLFFLIGGALGQALASGLHANVVSVRPSWQSTLAVAQKTYAGSALFGSGPSTFATQWLKYRDSSLNSTIFWNTNFSSGVGFIPTSFVTTGILGIIAWLGFLLFLIFFGLRMIIQRAPQDGYTRFVAITSFVGTLYLFTLAAFSLPNAPVLALAFVFAGLFISTTRYAAGSGQWGIIFARSPRIGFVIVFSLTIVLLSSVVTAYTLVGHYLATAQLTSANATLSTTGNLDDAGKAADNSIQFAPTAAAYEVQAAIANAKINQIVSSNGNGLTATAAQQSFQSTLSSGINSALTATRMAPNDYQAWFLLGNLYAQGVPLGVTGSFDSAKTAYEKAQALNPTNPQIPFILAQLDVANKDIKSAEANLKVAITLKQDYTAAIFLLSQLEVQDGNLKDALSAALAAAYFTPNDPNILFQVGILSAANNDLRSAQAALVAAVDASPQFANARYFLAAVYAKQGDLTNALTQLKAIAAVSDDNAKAVTTQIASLEAGKNPFPANLLSVSPPPQQ